MLIRPSVSCRRVMRAQSIAPFRWGKHHFEFLSLSRKEAVFARLDAVLVEIAAAEER